MRPPLTRAFLTFPPVSRFRVATPAANRYSSLERFLQEELQVFVVCVSQLSGRQTESARVVGAGRPEPLGARSSMNASTPPPRRIA